MAKKVDELPVYQKAIEFELAIAAILRRPGLRKDSTLRRQISSATDSVQANIEEGFEQGTDAAFARYLVISKGSAGELTGHIRRAHRKGYITDQHVQDLVPRAQEIGRMLGGFIKYLHRCDYRDRGRHTPTEDEDPNPE